MLTQISETFIQMLQNSGSKIHTLQTPFFLLQNVSYAIRIIYPDIHKISSVAIHVLLEALNLTFSI